MSQFSRSNNIATTKNKTPKIFFFIVVITLAIYFLGGGTNSYYTGPVTDHFDGKKFFNPNHSHKQNSFATLEWLLTHNAKEWPNKVENPLYNNPPSRVEGDNLRVHFIGHASFLIQTQGLNIVTDPWWSTRASFSNLLGPKRVRKLGINWEDLPKIDLVLISHNHYDHLDIETISQLWSRDKPRIITPLGNDTIIKKNQPHIQVEAYDWLEEININNNVTIALDKSKHWSARNLFDKNKALWAAFVIKTPGGNIYFIGDSGYEKQYFQQAAHLWQPIRVAILPIGAYAPRSLMKESHMSPKEAVRAMQDLAANYAIASHFETVQLTDEAFGDPRKKLNQKLELESIYNFKALDVGGYWNVPKN